MTEAGAALALWSVHGRLRRAPDPGLINQTWLVGEPPRAVLQWLNPIFSPLVNEDIHALGLRLRGRGLVSPEVLPTRSGALWAPAHGGASWRMLSFIPGHTHHRVASPDMAHAAGTLVGAFHRALADWDVTLRAPRRDVHNTPARMAALEQALEDGDGHPLEAPCRALGSLILRDWAAWQGTTDLPERHCHGDLKISNLRFGGDGQGICLIDLDTIGPMALSCELGDAWRSWCNPSGEDNVESVHFDVNLFAASAAGWCSRAPPLSTEERASLVPGIQRICLELAARFCADALRNSYFREDRARFPLPGAHNLHRARVQHRLATSALEQRPACDQIIGSLPWDSAS